MPLWRLWRSPDIPQLRAARNIPELIKATTYRPDWRVRRDAVVALRELALQAPSDASNEEIAKALLLSLRDAEWKIRQIAAEALGELEVREAIEALATTAQDSYVDVRWAAMRSLKRLLNLTPTEPVPPEAAATVIRALRDDAWWVRQIAANILEDTATRLQDPRLIHWATRWLHMALQDDYRIVRQAVVDALVAFGSPPTIASLVVALEDDAWSIRRSAAEALEVLQWEPPDDLHRAKFWIAKGECMRCVALGQVAVVPLVALLRDQYLPLYRQAVEALVALGPLAVRDLVGALEHRDYWVRAGAAEALGRIAAESGPDQEAFAKLLVALSDRSKTVREAAALALGAMGSADAVEPLIAVLDDPYATVRAAAATALGKIGSIKAVRALMQIGRTDPDWGVRRAAREALGAL